MAIGTDEITAGFTALAAATGAFAAVVSWRTVKEMERAREIGTRPHIIVSISEGGDLGDWGWFLVRVTNHGGPASDVRVSFSDPVPEVAREASLFKHPIPLMAPNESLSHRFAPIHNYFRCFVVDEAGGSRVLGRSDPPLRFRYSLTYADPLTGKTYRESKQVLSLAHFAPSDAEIEAEVQAGLAKAAESKITAAS